MNNNLEALYSSLKRHKPDYSKSINEFEADMQDENNRSALLQSLQRNYPNKFGQKDLATFSAELGIAASPKEPALQTQGNMQAPKIEEVIRPEDYAGEGSFYGLSDDELRKQIEDLDAAREAKKDSLRNEQAKRRESFWYRLGEIMNDANHATRGITPVERDQMEIDGVRLGADEEERYNRLTQEQTWRQRQAGSEYEQLGKSLVEARQRLDNIRDADGRDLDTGGAGAYLDKAIKLYQAPSKFGNGNGIKNWASGLGDQLADYDTWTVGVTEMARAINLNALVNKLNDGEELTDGEEAELEAFLLYGMVQDARQKDLSTGYTIGKGTAESIPFMAEMLITAGMGAAAKRGILTMLVKRGNNVAAKRLARIFGDEITGMTTEKILGKKVETVALKEVEQNLVERVGRQVGEDVLMTAFMPTTWAQVNEDAVEEKLSGDKNYSFGDFVRTFAGATIETGTEHWGGKIVDKAIGKVMPLDKIWGKTRWGKILSNDFIQSPFGETGEEYVGALANYIRSFDPAYSEQSNEKLRDEARRMFSIDGFAQTFLTVLPMSLAGGGINVGVVKHHINAYQSSKDELISMLQEYGATNEQAANIVMQIEGADDTKAFTEMLAQTERTLRMEYQKAHPDATEEDIKKQTDKLDKLLGKYYKSAYYLNEASGELRDAYNNLSDEQKRQVESDFAAAITAQIQEAEKRIENANKQEGAAIGVHVDEMPGTQETEQAAETSESGHANEEKQEAPIVSKEKVKGRSVTINVDGVEQQIQFSCTNAVFNEDGSIDYENSSMVYLQDKDGNLITGNHDAMLSALNDGLRLEKQNGDQLLANDKPIVEEPIDEQPVDEQPEDAAVEQKPYPVLEDGTPDFVQMTPEQQVAYAMENGGEEAAAETIQTAIEELTAELDGIGKKKGLIPAQRVAEKNRIRQEIEAWKALEQPQESAPAQSDIRPVGVGDFGPIYDQFVGKPQEAIAFLMERQDGECLGALSHPEIGPIDLVWGIEGTGGSDGYGLSKLIKFHPEVLNDLQGILNEMHVTQRSDNRIQLESERYKAGVRLTWNNESKTWLLTAFEKEEYKENSVPDKTTDTAETTKGGEGSDTALPQNTVSDHKDTTKNPDLQISKEKNAEKVDLTAENVVLMYNRNRSSYVFCRKEDDGTLVRLDTNKPLSQTHNGKDTAWIGIDKRTVRMGDKDYYILSTLNEKDLKTYSLKKGMINVMPTDGLNEEEVRISDLKWPDGTPVYKPSADRRDKQYSELRKNAKTLDDIADYVVLDYIKDGAKVNVTLRDLLGMLSRLNDDNERIYVGDKKYTGIIDKLISDMGKDENARADIEDILAGRVKEAAIVWNTLAEEGEKVGEGRTLRNKIRDFIDVLDKRGWAEKVDYFNGRTDAKPQEEVKPEQTPIANKRIATNEDMQALADLNFELREAKRAGDLEEVKILEQEIADLRSQIIELNVGNVEVNEEAGRRAIEYLKEKGVDIEEITPEEADRMIGEEKAEQLRNSDHTLYGIASNGKIYVISGRINPNTPVHEYTHLWARAFAKANPKKWADIVKVLKQTEQWQEVLNDADYASIKESEDAVASEVLARLSGDYWGQINEDGKSKMDETFEKKALIARMRASLRAFWKQVGEWLGEKINLRQSDADAQLQMIIRKPIQDLINLQSPSETDSNLEMSEKNRIFAEKLNMDRYESRITGNGETVAERRKATDSGLLEDAQRYLSRRSGDEDQVGRQGTGVEEDAERRNAEDAAALEQLAKERGQWIDDIESVFTERYGEIVGHGAESFVWLKDDGTVIKSRTIDPHAGGYATIQEALESIAIHNRIFPETAMKVVGFGMDEGELNIIFEQPYVEIERYATPEEIQQFVSENFGAEKDESVTGGQSYKTAAYLLQDLKPKNVIVKSVDGKEQLFVIDGDFYYTPEHRKYLDDTDAWLNDGDAELLVASPNDMPTGHAERMNWLQRAVNAVADQANGIRLMQKQIGEIEGKPIGMDKDVREALEAKRSKIANTLERFGNRQRRELKKALRNIQKSIKEKGLWHKGQTDDYLNEQGERSPRKVTLLNVLEEYLEAKDILERLDQGRNVRLEELPVRLLQQMGMSFEEATQEDLATVEQKASILQRWVEEFENKIPKEQVDALWSAVNGCTNFTLDVLLDGGLIGQNLYDELKQSKYYVPERGFAQLESDEDVRNEAEQVHNWKSRAKSNSPEATRKAKGGKSMATDVIANILNLAVNAVSCAEENKVRQVAFNLLKDHQEACLQLGYPAAERVWYVRDGVDEEGEPRYKAQIEKPSAEIMAQNEEVLEQIRGYREDMALFEDNKAMQDYIREKIKETQKELLIVRKADAGDAVKIRAGLAGEDVPRVVVTMPTSDGETEQYTMVFPNHREISNALNGIYNSIFTDSWLKNVGRFFSSMFTTYNPLFWSRNLPRDAMFVLQKGTAERGIGYGAFFAAEMARPATTIAPIVAWVSGREMESEIGRDFRKFLDGGGNTGFTQMKDIDAFRKEADELVNGENYAVAGLQFIFGKVPAALNEFSELWTRFAVYRATKASLAMENKMIQTLGRSAVDVKRTTPYSEDEIEAMALHDSRNFSTNFNRRGAGGLIDFFNSISMFANASIQGAMGVYRTFEQGEWQKGIRGGLSLMIVPALLGYLLTKFTPDSDDKENWIPDYIRQNNLVFLDKRVPLSYELVPWYRIGVNYALMEQKRLSKTDGIENIAKGFAEHSLPAPPAISGSLKEIVDMVVPETDFNGKNPNFWQAILPLIYGEFANPFMELSHGKNWAGSNLRYQYAKDQPQWMYQDYEAELYKSISKQLFELAGGDMNNPSITVNGKKMNDFQNMSPKEVKTALGSITPNGWLKIACYGWGLYKGNVREQDEPLKSDFMLSPDAEMGRIGISAEMGAMIREAKENYTRVPGLREMNQNEAKQRIKEWDSIYKDYTELRNNGANMTDNNRKALQRRLEREYRIRIDGNSIEDLMHAYIIVMANEEMEMKGLERTIGDLERWRKKYDIAKTKIFNGK